ncbi:MAG TPA: hypothetical protein VII72_10740 [Myxococcota bacterium]|jgi:hypothetical protein
MLVRSGSGIALLVLALAGAVLGGCSRRAPQQLVWYPPRVDLARWGTLGLIEFSASGSQGLAPLASREFLSALQSAQPGTPVLELGDEARVLAGLGVDALGPDAIRAIGERHRVDALIVGGLTAKPSAPSVAFDTGGRWLSASAELEGTLDARIFDTRTGATVWSTAARASEPLGRVDISPSGVAGLGANPVEKASHRLVRRLASRATADFWGRWE